MSEDVDAPTVEAPTTALPGETTAEAGGDGPPPWQPPPEPGSAATPPGPPARSGVVVPAWALLTVAGLLLLGLGFLGGWLLAPGDGGGEQRAISSHDLRDLRQLLPFGDRNGGQLTPGNGDGFGNDGGSGSTQSGGVYLGVVLQDSSDPTGASIVRVASSSPASRAGLENGDVITAIDDDTVRNAAQLTQRIRAHDAGDRVTIAYTRDGENETVEVRLGERPQLELPAVPDIEPRDPF